MNIPFSRAADPQRAPIRACCSICGASLYRGDSYWQVNGQRFCENCLDTLARQEFAAHHYICEEERE